MNRPFPDGWVRDPVMQAPGEKQSDIVGKTTGCPALYQLMRPEEEESSRGSATNL
jgi:hypothetical protein